MEPKDEIRLLLLEQTPDSDYGVKWTIMSRGAALKLLKRIEPLAKEWTSIIKMDKPFTDELSRLMRKIGTGTTLQRFEIDVRNILKITKQLQQRKD